ncbi:MAG TPA: thioredoxin family protein [Quisquiliibacterium sp.]|nr:thioredoxin family protein [Quisquiliibacterium sp.]
MSKILMLLLAAWLAASGAAAQPVRVDAVEVELVAQHDAAVAGGTLMLGLRIRHDPHWHPYWRNPGDSGLPTRLDLELPEGWKAGEIAWPAPTRIFVGPLANYGYEGEILLPIPVSVPAGVAAGTVRIGGRAQWLMCRDVCIPGEAALTLSLPVAAAARPSASATLFERAAIASPRAVVPARAALAEGRVSLVFERAEAGSAEFFPYREALVSAPAPQRLYRLDGGAWRLELALADGADRAALARDGVLSGPIGVMVLDGEPFEIAVGPGDAGAAVGTLVSTAEGSDRSRGPFGGGPGGSKLLEGTVQGAPAGAGVAGAGASASGLTLAVAAAFGVIGGLILNLMPCVFPVIGLKVLGFAGHGGADRRETRRGALAFAAGVLVSFWVLAALLLALREAGQAVGWGFQLQSPPFVAAMALLFVAIGLNLAGVFEFGLGLTRLGGAEAAAAGRGGPAGSFASGVLAVLVATPCTAPFMGSALGYTLGRSALELFTVFGAIAIGMALPYVLLGFNPGALRWLPRPGRWMESFRQLLAFPMFATVAWLAWVLGLQAGVDAVLALAMGAVLLALAAWLYGRFVQAPGGSHRALAGGFALVSLAAGLWLAWPASDAIAPSASTGADPAAPGAANSGASPAGGAGGGAQTAAAWGVWSAAEVERARAAGRPVFVDFTAAWCVSCQANKKLVLERESVAAEMARRGVLRLRADWTQRDPAITAALASHGRNGVPLYLLYLPGESQPRVLPEILTPGIVLDELARLR